MLPFADMSPKKDQEYMSDGIAEELLNVLAKVPDLKVIARTSSFAFKGEKVEIAEIARRAERRPRPRGQRAHVRQQGAHHRAAHPRQPTAPTCGRKPTTGRSMTSSRCRTRSPARSCRRCRSS